MKRREIKSQEWGSISPLFVKRMTAEEPTMKTFLFAGLILVVLGIASLVVPIPHSETQGIKIGDASIGVRTSHSERVSPIISVVLIAAGIALTIAGTRGRLSNS